MLNKITTLLLFTFSLNLFSSDKGVGVLYFKGHELEKKKVDILFVLDDSGSMQSQAESIRPRIIGFLHEMNKFSDWRAGFITTDKNIWQNINAGMNGEINHLNPNSMNMVNESIISFMNGRGDATENLYENVLNSLNYFPNFQRVNSSFITIHVSDEDDNSELTTSDFVTEYKKRYNDILSFRSISYKAGSSCPGNEWSKTPKIDELIRITMGERFALCENFSAPLANSIVKAVKLNLKLALPTNVNEKVYQDGKLIEHTLDQTRKIIFIKPNKMIKDETQIKVVFDL